jgi:hypothetical protein
MVENNIPQDWMNPLNRLALTKAVKAREKTVTLDNKIYRLNYELRPDKVWVYPLTGSYVPSGWFDIKRIKSNAFIEHSR